MVNSVACDDFQYIAKILIKINKVKHVIHNKNRIIINLF